MLEKGFVEGIVGVLGIWKFVDGIERVGGGV